KFDYTYDNAGRLATANFNQIVNPSDSWNNAAVDFSVSGSGPSNSLNYDLDGNLQSMVQKGIVPGHTSPMTVDSLAYTYAAYSSKLTGVADNGNLGSLDGQLGDFHDATNGDAGTSGAYLYDDNGNLTTDLYKNINQLTGSGDTRGISYNYLDKPDQVRIVGKGTIQFIYDADGNKLQKVFTPESGSSLPAMTLTYIGEFIYAASSSPGNTNLGPDNLRYILFEEGRLRTIQSTSGATLTITGNIDMPDGTQGVFDYFVKDHLGNTRMVLTEETHVATSECTMELAYDYSESRQFGQIDANGNPTANNEVEQRFAVKNIPGQGTNGGGWTNPHIQDFVSQVGNLASSQMGPNTLLKVMAGDQISANVIFYYQSTASRQNNSSLLTAMIISLAAALSGSPSTTAITHENVSGITDNLTGTSDLINLTNPGSGPATATTPQAYLSVLFFDEQMNFISDGSIQSQVYPTGSYGGNIATFQKAPKNGYAFVFVSNQSDEMVYFDNLIVQQHYGNIIEEDHYYPFGLKIAGISSQKLGNSNEGTLDNKYRFQGDFSEEEDYTSWNEFDLRMYNPQIGRWNQQDPFDQFATPYVAMGNDPINYADPGGGISFDFGELGGITGSVFGDRALISFGGALVGYGIDKFAGGKGWIGAITGGLTGLGATFIPAFDVDIDLNEVFSPSWASALLWQVHQKANENALLAETPPNESNSIDARRRAMNQGTVWADSKKNQTSPNSYMHAMSDGRHRQPVEEADLEANNHVRKYWALARAAQAKGNEFEAYRNLGIAIHPLQDATSPAHHGFQPWDEDESFEEKVRHTLKENKYPGPTSNLQKVTNTYVDLFMNSRLPLPEGDLFKSIEADKQSNPDDVIEGFIRFMRIRFFDYSPLGGDHSLQ
ncbi:MAG TPA: RHS repeat-associated core domain-containing protein, partial [Puia sp.]|nr:RHS repeat-associated core domain-containing protein [Puia sp.]